MALVPTLYVQQCRNRKEAKITMQINKIQQPPIFARKLQILIKSFFPNRIFCFLLLCVQEVVQYGTIPVLGQGHFFIVTSGLPGRCYFNLDVLLKEVVNLALNDFFVITSLYPENLQIVQLTVSGSSCVPYSQQQVISVSENRLIKSVPDNWIRHGARYRNHVLPVTMATIKMAQQVLA